jgi:hypothetical protein
MFTLLTTVVSFLTGGLPSMLKFFQDKADQSHELQMAQLQMERELKMAEAGYLAQAHVEEIKTEQVALQTSAQERVALYAHDIEIGKGASTWVINARAMVRPTITYGLFFLLVFVDLFGFYYAISTGVEFVTAMDQLWDDDTQTIWASVVSFWFGTQAFSKK